MSHQRIDERRQKLGAYIVRLDRVRRGKIQRRKLRSIRKGYRIVGRRLVRMKTKEIRKRKISNIFAVRKRKAKRSMIMRRRRISFRKGKILGIYR